MAFSKAPFQYPSGARADMTRPMTMSEMARPPPSTDTTVEALRSAEPAVAMVPRIITPRPAAER